MYTIQTESKLSNLINIEINGDREICKQQSQSLSHLNTMYVYNISQLRK